MSDLLFPKSYLTDGNKELLQSIVGEFGLYCDDDDLTVDCVLDEICHSYIYDNRVIKIERDEYCDFDELTGELFAQGIPYDLVHYSDHISNSAVEFFREYMQYPEYVFTDSNNNPTLNIDTIRRIIDSQDEGLKDFEVMNILIEKINDCDFKREGNRIQDAS